MFFKQCCKYWVCPQTRSKGLGNWPSNWLLKFNQSKTNPLCFHIPNPNFETIDYNIFHHGNTEFPFLSESSLFWLFRYHCLKCVPRFSLLKTLIGSIILSNRKMSFILAFNWILLRCLNCLSISNYRKINKNYPFAVRIVTGLPKYL